MSHPSPSRTIPYCLQQAVQWTVRSSTTATPPLPDGHPEMPPPYLVRFLDGREKAMICPFYDDPWADDAQWIYKRGDGIPIFTEPGSNLFSPFPPSLQPQNIRMAVPLWVLRTSSLGDLVLGKAEVIGVGHIHPFYSTAAVDFYKDGLFYSRQMILGPSTSRILPEQADQLMLSLALKGAGMAAPLAVAPHWEPGGVLL